MRDSINSVLQSLTEGFIITIANCTKHEGAAKAVIPHVFRSLGDAEEFEEALRVLFVTPTWTANPIRFGVVTFFPRGAETHFYTGTNPPEGDDCPREWVKTEIIKVALPS
jgi:hypothetical protein